MHLIGSSLILAYDLDWEQIRNLEQKPFVEASIEVGLLPGSQTLLVEGRGKSLVNYLQLVQIHVISIPQT